MRLARRGLALLMLGATAILSASEPPSERARLRAAYSAARRNLVTCYPNMTAAQDRGIDAAIAPIWPIVGQWAAAFLDSDPDATPRQLAHAVEQLDPHNLSAEALRLSDSAYVSCGTCPEPEVTWRLRVTPNGIRDLGEQHGVPELQQCDVLWQRLARRARTDDVAAPQVAQALRPIADELAQDAGERSSILGMLGAWKLADTPRGRVLHLESDELDCNVLDFDVERRPSGPYFTAVRVTHPCRG